MGDPRRAIEFYGQLLEIACEIGDRRGEGNALFNMALQLVKLGERKRAIEAGERSLAIFEQIENPNADMVRAALAEWRGGG